MKLQFTSVWLILQTGISLAATMPQDTWTYYGRKFAVPDTAQKKSIAVGTTAVYLGAGPSNFSATSVQKYTLAGAYVSTLSTTFSNVTGLGCDTAGNLYVFDRGAGSLKSFDPTGTLRWSKGSSGTGPEQFSTATDSTHHSNLAIDESNRIFVLDAGNWRVQVFNTQGDFQFSWGTAGTNGGQFQNAFAIAAKNGQVMVVDSFSGFNRQRIQRFTADGTFTSSVGWPASPSFIVQNERFAFSPDGLLSFVGSTGIPGPLCDASLNQVGSISKPAALSNLSTNRLGGAFLPNGDLCLISAAEVWILERRYASTDNALTHNALPQPDVIASVQRPASTLLDIDYKVVDPDSATVDVAALAFVNGNDSLADLLKVNTLVEGTASNIGPGQATNTVKRLTWNAGADWSSQLGNVQIEILAKDQRDLLGIHWITVPAGGGNPSFSASAAPVSDSDLLSLWYWLIAKNDPGISLTGGVIKGVGGNYNGQTLASGTTTTSQGRAFIYAKLGIRAPTAGELATIQSGNYGFATSDGNTVIHL